MKLVRFIQFYLYLCLAFRICICIVFFGLMFTASFVLVCRWTFTYSHSCYRVTATNTHHLGRFFSCCSYISLFSTELLDFSLVARNYACVLFFVARGIHVFVNGYSIATFKYIHIRYFNATFIQEKYPNRFWYYNWISNPISAHLVFFSICILSFIYICSLAFSVKLYVPKNKNAM